VADFFDERANQKNQPRGRLLEKVGQFTDSNFDFNPYHISDDMVKQKETPS
jgi:acyl dehydratase